MASLSDSKKLQVLGKVNRSTFRLFQLSNGLIIWFCGISSLIKPHPKNMSVIPACTGRTFSSRKVVLKQKFFECKLEFSNSFFPNSFRTLFALPLLRDNSPRMRTPAAILYYCHCYISPFFSKPFNLDSPPAFILVYPVVFKSP